MTLMPSCTKIRPRVSRRRGGPRSPQTLCWPLVLALVVLAAGGSAVQAKTFRWALPAGSEFRLVVDRTVRLKTRTTEWTESIRYQAGWRVAAVAEDGQMQIFQTVQEVKHSLQISNAEPVVYDSTQDIEVRGDAVALARQWMPSLNVERPLVMQSRGRLTRVEAAAKADVAPATVPNATGGGRQMPPRSLQGTMLEFPEQDLLPGDDWTETTLVAWGEISDAIAVKTRYTYQGEEPVEQRSLDKFQVAIVWEPQPAAVESDRFRIDRQAGTGLILFDAEAGHLSRSDSTVDLTLRFPRAEGPSEQVDVVTVLKTRLQPIVPAPEIEEAATLTPPPTPE